MHHFLDFFFHFKVLYHSYYFLSHSLPAINKVPKRKQLRFHTPHVGIHLAVFKPGVRFARRIPGERSFDVFLRCWNFKKYNFIAFTLNKVQERSYFLHCCVKRYSLLYFLYRCLSFSPDSASSDVHFLCL